MITSFPGLLLVIMIILTLVLLPYLADDRARPVERTGRTEELHVKVKGEAHGTKREV